MSLEKKVAALERRAPVKLCSVTYKVNQGPEGEVMLPMDKALQEARTGRVKEIRFPLTFNEQQKERLYAHNQVERWFTDAFDGIQRDTTSTENLILCSRPIVSAKQAPPRDNIGGYFTTEDGQTFHQSEYKEILKQHNAGFIIVRDYDESREPWHGRRNT